MGLFDSAGGNGFFSDPERVAGLQGSLMGLAQGLLSQGPGENWGQALGRGFGAAGALSKQYKKDVRAKDRRGREEKFRDYLEEQLDPNGDKDRQAMLQAALAGGDPGAIVMGMAGLYNQRFLQGKEFKFGEAQQGRQFEHLDEAAKSRVLADLEQRRLMGEQQLGLQGLIGDQTRNQIFQRGGVQSSLMGKDDRLLRGRMELGSGQRITEAELMNKLSMERDTSLAGHTSQRDAELNEYAQRAAFLNQGYGLERDLQRSRLNAENEARGRLDNFNYGTMTDEQRHLYNRDMVGLDQNWRAEVMQLNFANARDMFGLSADHDMAMVTHRRKENEIFRDSSTPAELKMLKERYGLEEDLQKKGIRYTWAMNDRLARNARGVRSAEAAKAFKRMTSFQANQAGKGHEYRLAEMQFASDLAATESLPAAERDGALRAIYERIRSNDQLPDAQRMDAEKLLELSPAQLQQAVIQERQISASLQSSFQAQDERRRALADSRQYENYRYGSRLGEKRGYEEGSPRSQVQDRWATMQMGMSDPEFMDTQKRNDWIEGEIQRRLRSGQGAGILPGLPPGR